MKYMWLEKMIIMIAHNKSKEKLEFLFIEYNCNKHLILIIANVRQNAYRPLLLLVIDFMVDKNI